MSFQPWANPDPQSIFGMNSAMVYGENMQVAVGLNNQIALGNNTQLCINPLVLFDMFSVPGTASLSALWGSGLGGNMQFTIGSSTNVVWGRQFQVNLGPESINIAAGGQKPMNYVLCGLVGAAAIAYAIAYGLEGDEDGRANVLVIFQALMTISLAVFMGTEMALWEADKDTTKVLKALFNSQEAPGTNKWWQDLISFLSALAVLPPLIFLEPVLVSQEEGHFQGETQSQG
jgi:hypothetical protein